MARPRKSAEVRTETYGKRVSKKEKEYLNRLLPNTEALLEAARSNEAAANTTTPTQSAKSKQAPKSPKTQLEKWINLSEIAVLCVLGLFLAFVLFGVGWFAGWRAKDAEVESASSPQTQTQTEALP